MASSITQMPPRIDVHAHIIPPAYRAACLQDGHSKPDGMPGVPAWSPEDHLKMMDEIGISKAIVSISSPGTHLVAGEDDKAAQLARYCNSYASQELKKKYPARFGYFASLPLPNITSSLKEIELGADEGCDGFVVMSNSHGVYIGDKRFDAVFDELNHQKAILFIHPTTPKCPCSGNAGDGSTDATPLAGTYANPMLEFFFDTARVVTNLFLSGTVKRCPDIKFVIPHLGGCMPPLLSRFTGFSGIVPGAWEAVSQDEAEEAFARQFWFDLAGFPFPSQIKGLMDGAGVKTDRIVYGTDYCFTPAPLAKNMALRMDEGMKGMFNDDEIHDMYSRNAETLFRTTNLDA
ncbi:Hypothetical protein R9X50_00223500 [Acrodontium crateriforme]|uniref:6-methylsalicylate decarboxylase n=1 Tax=Acrodontium crateriforme TaxID=150365 RepID=A0AAQ3M1V8_9PEZI|nr:Hypothetical protein R9X50_00223500 [Acrodontium crateriforme]